jgi:hypothetical protein
MNSLQRSNGLDDFLKTSGKKKKGGNPDTGKTWLEDAFAAMSPGEAESHASE